jgi:hypothetical protein
MILIIYYKYYFSCIIWLKLKEFDSSENENDTYFGRKVDLSLIRMKLVSGVLPLSSNNSTPRFSAIGLVYMRNYDFAPVEMV